jgi:hypothetical protein
MRKILLLIGCLFLPAICSAQGIPFAVNPPAPNAVMNVCGAPALGNPCTNTITIYSNVALSVTISQPVQIGPTGNYTFFYNSSSAPITVQITGRTDQIVGGGGGGSPGLSGMTAGQVPVAATASTVTSSKALQGTDTNILTSGTVSGLAANLCTDANGGATTSGCTAGGVTSVSGTANQIDSTGGATPVLSLDAAVTLPGSVAGKLVNSVVVLTPGTTGTHWTDKLVTAYGTAQCSSGCTIQIPDSVADDGFATTPSIPSNVSVQFTGSATFDACNITIGGYTKLDTGEATLQVSPSGSNCTLLTQSGLITLQNNDHMIISGRFDCNSQTGSNAIALGNDAQVSLREMRIANCLGVGLNAQATQFSEIYNLQLYNNAIGAKFYSVSGSGGANSLNMYGFKAVGNTVGVVVANKSAFPQTSIFFYNPSFISNSITSLAVFGTSTNQTDVHWIGGAPELGGGGAASITIDGNVIKRATVYANQAAFFGYDIFNSEATITPSFFGENNSNLYLTDIRGYGASGGTQVQTDLTSSSCLSGTIDTLGEFQNVTCWPSGINGKTSVTIGTRMYGAPVLSYNSAFPNSFTGNSQTPAVTSVGAGASNSTASDAVYGTVTTSTHAASVGSATVNDVLFPTLITSATGVTSDLFGSFLIKSSVNVGSVLLSTGTPPSNSGGNVWVYTFAATQTAAGSNGWVGGTATISGYTGGATGNNGVFVITASTTTTMTITNATGTATNTGTPVFTSPVTCATNGYRIQMGVGTFSDLEMCLVANQWTRIVVYMPAQLAGVALTPTGFPQDTSAPTISWTGFEGLAGAAGSPNTQYLMSVALTTGATGSNNGSAASPVYGFAGSAGRGFFNDTGSNGIGIGVASAEYGFLGSGLFQTNNSGVFGFSSGAAGGGTASDTGLSRDSAGVVDVGTGAQGSKAGTINAATVNVTSALTIPSGTQYGILDRATATTLGQACTPPTTVGTFTLEYVLASAAAVQATCPQVGLAARTDVATSGSPIVAADTAAGDVVYAAATAAAVTVPTPTTLANSNPVFATDNNLTAGAVTFTPTTLTVNGGATLVQNQKQHCLWFINPALSTDWFAQCMDRAGFINGLAVPTSATGIATNSSGQPVQQTSANILAICTTCVATGQTNVYGAFLQDFTAGTMEIPEAAGFTTNVNSTIGLDTTANAPHVWSNSADAVIASEASVIAAGFLPKSTDATHGLLTATLCDEAITTANTLTCTDTAGIASPKFTSTGTTAGFVDYPQGTTSAAVAPCNVATSICEQAPTAVTSYLVTKPGAAPNIASYQQTDGCAAASCTMSYHPVPVLLTVASDFTDSTTSTLTLITGLSTTMPVSKAVVISAHCALLFDQATAAVSDSFGIGVTGTAPTSANASATSYTAAGVEATGTLVSLASTTPTAIVTFTPSAITTVWKAELDATVEQPSNATPGVFGIYVSTSTGADNIIVKRGSYCSVIYQ